MVKISVDQKECIGCGFCESAAPEIFHIEDGGNGFKAKVKKDGELAESASLELSEEKLKQAKEAAEGCPVQVINITE
jgi:ferredoxin